jgi:ribosome-associated protein
LLPEELVKLIATVMDEEQAADIRILEVAELTVLADYFLIATGKNSHHIKSISDAVSARTKAAAIPVLHSDGYEESHWVILDFGSVIAHIFRQQERDYYRLEQLWGEAKAT